MAGPAARPPPPGGGARWRAIGARTKKGAAPPLFPTKWRPAGFEAPAPPRRPPPPHTATPRAAGTRADAIDIINADTDRTPYDTGTFASTGTVVAGKAVHMAAEALRDDILDFACRHTDIDRAQCRLGNDAVICGNKRITLSELHAEGAKINHRFSVGRRSYLSPRSIAFNVQGVRLAVHKITD